MDRNVARVLGTCAIWISPAFLLALVTLMRVGLNVNFNVPGVLTELYIWAMFGATLSIWIVRD